MVKRPAVQDRSLLQPVFTESLITIVVELAGFHVFALRFHIENVEMLVSRRCQSQIDVTDRPHVRIATIPADFFFCISLVSTLRKPARSGRLRIGTG
jgi:hypothetical protein